MGVQRRLNKRMSLTARFDDEGCSEPGMCEVGRVVGFAGSYSPPSELKHEPLIRGQVRIYELERGPVGNWFGRVAQVPQHLLILSRDEDDRHGTYLAMVGLEMSQVSSEQRREAQKGTHVPLERISVWANTNAIGGLFSKVTDP